MSRLECVAALVLAGMCGSNARADEKSHRQAVEDLFQAMQMDKVMDASIDQMLEVQMKANPALAQIRDVMRKFFAKHLSYAATKDDLVKVYAAEFSEPELKELTAFYKTPVGKKTIEKMPTLMQKGATIGLKRVQDNQAELERMIQDALGGKKDN